jgi:hypothetical protein
MAKHSSFAEKAGMHKITLQEPSVDVLRVAEGLKELGFDLRLLASQVYVQASLKG